MSSSPSLASGAVPRVAIVAPSALSRCKVSKTSRSAVPRGASGARNTSSRYQPSRAGIGLAASKPTKRPLASRAVNNFFRSALRNGSSAKSQPKVVAARRVLNHWRHNSAVSFLSSLLKLTTLSIRTPARSHLLGCIAARLPHSQVKVRRRADLDCAQAELNPLACKAFCYRYEGSDAFGFVGGGHKAFD